MPDRIATLLLVLLLCNLPTRASQPATITVDPTHHFQRIDGFGVNGSWWAQRSDHWPKKILDHALDLLFTARGANLTIYRYNIGAGSGEEIHALSHRTTSVEASPGKYDLSRDHVAVSVLDQVIARGVKNIIGIAYSPPARLTRNGLVSGGDNGGPNLRPGAESQYAEYLVDITELIRQHAKLPRIALSPINEPQWHWGSDKRSQEGCYYSPEQAATVIEAVLKEVCDRHLPIDVQAPDLGRWGNESTDYVRALLDLPFINAHLATLTVHSYFSTAVERQSLVDLIHKFNPRLPIAMSEFCQMETGRHLDMDAGLEMAQIIYDDLTLGNVTAWEWWLGISTSDYADGLLYITPYSRSLLISKRLDVLAQFSRFIRPGFTRIAAESSDQNLKVVAFSSPDHSQIVVVAMNPGDSPLSLNLRVPDGFQLQHSFITDATRALDPSTRLLNSPPRSLLSMIYLKNP